MLIALWSSKGGVGVTVTSLLTARRLARRGSSSVLLVDLDGDLPAAAGISADGPGVADWTRAGVGVRPDTLARLVRPVAPGLDLLPRGTGPFHEDRLDLLLQLLRERGGPAVLDLGRLRTGDPLLPLLREVDRSVLVVRPCYLAMRRATGLGEPVDALVVVDEPGRSLGTDDLARMIGAPLTLELPLDPSLARLVDAGLLLRRPHRRGDDLDRLLPPEGQVA